MLAVLALVSPVLTACAEGALSQNRPPASSLQPPAQGGPSPSEYLPLSVGTEWTYEVRGGGQKGQETIRIVGQDGAWFLDDHRGRMRYEADGVRDRDRYLLRAPLLPGKGWTAVADMVVQRFEVSATDAVLATPAGRFERCVVVRNDQTLPTGGRFVTEWTYAPGVGLVSLRTTAAQPGQKPQEQTSLVLLSFKRP